jgi:hypothetical protein
MWVATTVPTHPLVVNRTTTNLGKMERVLSLVLVGSCRRDRVHCVDR